MPNSAILVSMDVRSLYTNIPQREGITTVCHAYEEFHQGNPPVYTRFLSEMLSLILQENSFQFNGKDYLQTHGTAMGTKMAVASANIFMAKIEKEILRQSRIQDSLSIIVVLTEKENVAEAHFTPLKLKI